MLFNTVEFFIFFPTVLALYLFLPFRARLALLLLASCYFYMRWKPVYIVLLLISTVLDYFVGYRITQTDSHTKKKILLSISIIGNLGLLFIFKYANFFASSLRSFCAFFRVEVAIPELELILPVGISFYTFQTLSYTIDIYKGKIQPEKNFGRFALFVTFFPQLVAGPIERASHLLPQFLKKRDVTFERFASGSQLILWGLFKKVVVADRLAPYVNSIYNNPHTVESGWYFIIATYFFAFQIYCDFSGYSDIAIGTANILGFDIMKNFHIPYLSTSIPEFWRRWHISLSTWFKDYLYIPLGGNRVNNLRKYFNIMIIFLVSGLWHGANWTFVVWGFLHGIYQVIAIVAKASRNRCIKILAFLPNASALFKIIITFHLVCFAWIFFRANTLNDALYITQNIFLNISDLQKFTIHGFHLPLPRFDFFLCLLVIFIHQFVEALSLQFSEHSYDSDPSTQLKMTFIESPLRWVFSFFIIALIVLFGKTEESQFIYFQF